MPVRSRILAVALVTAFAANVPLTAIQDGHPSIPIDEIVRGFTAKEQEFKLARNRYTFRQDVRIQELDPRGNVQYDTKGNAIEYRMVTDILFDDRGGRVEKNIERPSNRLYRLGLTAEDFEDIRNIQPFVLTTQDAPLYTLRYTGRGNAEEIDCYIFEVSPKRIEPGQRYFQGTIWVDREALQIVKTYGKAVPDLNRGWAGENLFPRFETIRRRIDGRYWFPVLTLAEDTLQFSTSLGGPLRVRHIVRYENYKQFVSEITITPEGIIK